MNAENLAKVMQQQSDALTELVGSAPGTSALTDTRGIGRPVVFKGDEGSTLSGRRSWWPSCAYPRDDPAGEEDVKRAYPKNPARRVEVRFQLVLHLAVVYRGRPFPNLPL